MKTTTLVWIDQINAKIFSMNDGKIESHHLHSGKPEHHTHAQDRTYEGEHAFFKTVQKQIKDGGSIIIMGPGLAKNRFQSFIQEHDAALSKNITQVITTDHPTDNQIREYFNE